MPATKQSLKKQSATKMSLAGRVSGKQKNQELILQGSLLRAILALCVPIALNSLLQSMYNLTDTYWLGKIGTNPMAAITLISPLQNIVINFGQGITAAGAILMAQFIGGGKKKEANGMVGQLFLCAMLFAVFCSAACVVSAGAIVGWMGAEGEIFDLSRTYLSIVILDVPFLFLINLYASVNQAQGDTVRPMLLNIAGILFNMVLDPLFMLKFGWGIAGAALATLLAKVPSALVALWLLTRKNQEIFLDLGHLSFDKEKVLMILKIGLPTAIGSSTMQFGFLLMSKNVYTYGSGAVAAYGIGNKVNSLVTLPCNAVGSATATIVGQNMGAKQRDRAETAYKTARRLAVITLFLGGMVLSRPFVSRFIVSIFSADENVIGMAAQFLRIMALCCWTNGIYNSTMGLFQGTGHTLVTMTIDATRLWVFRFLTLYICEAVFHMGVQSIWYSVVVSNASSALILLICYKLNIWKKEVIHVDRRASGVHAKA
ncbi:MAG: MATE family efflux transporter [bacterium]|nr:MATE family efflux transporter [bacterium]